MDRLLGRLVNALLPRLRNTHITPTLKSLYWLQVRDRIIFKILLLVFHCVKGSAPHYNMGLVHKYTPARSLRSSNSDSLLVQKFAKTWGERAFAHASPALWNNLPLELQLCRLIQKLSKNLLQFLCSSEIDLKLYPVSFPFFLLSH